MVAVGPGGAEVTLGRLCCCGAKGGGARRGAGGRCGGRREGCPIAPTAPTGLGSARGASSRVALASRCVAALLGPTTTSGGSERQPAPAQQLGSARLYSTRLGRLASPRRLTRTHPDSGADQACSRACSACSGPRQWRSGTDGVGLCAQLAERVRDRAAVLRVGRCLGRRHCSRWRSHCLAPWPCTARG